MANSKHILVVDDSPSMRQMVSFAITGAGYTVSEAEDGLDGLNKAKGTRFDAIISDVNMPKMDGIALIRAVRSIPEYRFTPLLMLTTEAGLEKKQEGKAAGATGWLVKPFNPEQLVLTLNRVFS